MVLRAPRVGFMEVPSDSHAGAGQMDRQVGKRFEITKTPERPRYGGRVERHAALLHLCKQERHLAKLRDCHRKIVRQKSAMKSDAWAKTRAEKRLMSSSLSGS